MSNREVQFLLTLRDEATKKWQEFQSTVGTGTDKMKSMFSSLGGIITAAFAITALKKFSDAAAEHQEQMIKTTALTVSTGRASEVTAAQMEIMARHCSDITGVQKDVVLGAESVLLTFTAISTKTFPDVIKTALGVSEVMGMDLTSAVRILGRALSDPAAGMMALRRVGVMFTQDQKDTIKAMQATQGAAAAQAYELNILLSKYGPVVDAMKDMDRVKFTQLVNAMHEAEVSFGTFENIILVKVAPVLTWLVEQAFPWVQKGVYGISTAFLGAIYAILTPLAWLEKATNALGITTTKTFEDMQANAGKAMMNSAALAGQSTKSISDSYKKLTETLNATATSGTGVADALNYAKGSQSDYDKQIPALQEKLKGLTIGSSDYVSMLAKIIAKQKELKDLQDHATSEANWKNQLDDMNHINTAIGKSQIAIRGTTPLINQEASAALDLSKKFDLIHNANVAATAEAKKYHDQAMANWQDQHQYIIGPLRAGIASWAEGLKGTAVTWNTAWQQMKGALVDFLADYVAKWAAAAIANAAISDSSALASAAVVGTAMGGIAAAALPAATLTSIASFGAADVAASAGMASTFAVAEGLSVIPKFAEGTPPEGFNVPEGFPNDSFRIGVSTGEKVHVVPANKVADAASAIKTITPLKTTLLSNISKLSGLSDFKTNRSVVNNYQGNSGIVQPRVNETATTKAQESSGQRTGNIIHIHIPNAIISSEEGAVKLLKNALQKSGFNSITDLITNDRRGYSFGTA